MDKNITYKGKNNRDDAIATRRPEELLRNNFIHLSIKF